PPIATSPPQSTDTASPSYTREPWPDSPLPIEPPARPPQVAFQSPLHKRPPSALGQKTKHQYPTARCARDTREDDPTPDSARPRPRCTNLQDPEHERLAVGS